MKDSFGQEWIENVGERVESGNGAPFWTQWTDIIVMTKGGDVD